MAELCRPPHAIRVLFVSPEVVPLAKTGGLADVSAAFPVTLEAAGADVRIMMPGYPQALDTVIGKRVIAILDDGLCHGRIIEAAVPASGMVVYLYDCPELYDRLGALYQNADGDDWWDNHLRFAAFCQAAAKVALGEATTGWRPDILHANDWHTGLLPFLLADRPDRPATVFTIHNLAFQGNFDLDVAEQLHFPSHWLTPDGAEFFGRFSFLKAGIRFADQLTTVSPNYAKEILTPEFGCGMDGLLRSRADALTGILNGVDYSVWDPSTDAALTQRYAPSDLRGKVACKAALREETGLAQNAVPLMIFANRLTDQKMADILLQALPAILSQGIQVLVHGRGDRALEAAFAQAAHTAPGQLCVRIGYDEIFARRATAAADLSLTASRFEPCGLTTMYAMRYGALPVTRHVGGIADTVVDVEGPANDEGPSGFVFGSATPDAMADSARRAADWYGRPHWFGLQQSAMRRDFRWGRSAQRYIELYRKMLPTAFARREEETPAHAVSA